MPPTPAVVGTVSWCCGRSGSLDGPQTVTVPWACEDISVGLTACISHGLTEGGDCLMRGPLPQWKMWEGARSAQG